MLVNFNLTDDFIYLLVRKLYRNRIGNQRPFLRRPNNLIGINFLFKHFGRNDDSARNGMAYHACFIIADGFCFLLYAGKLVRIVIADIVSIEKIIKRIAFPESIVAFHIV